MFEFDEHFEDNATGWDASISAKFTELNIIGTWNYLGNQVWTPATDTGVQADNVEANEWVLVESA